MAIIRSGIGFYATNRHVVSAYEFKTVSDCDQLVFDPTHARGGTLALLLTDAHDLVRIVAPIGNTNHSSPSAVISMAPAVRNLCVSRKVFLKHQLSQLEYCLWCNKRSA